MPDREDKFLEDTESHAPPGAPTAHLDPARVTDDHADAIPAWDRRRDGRAVLVLFLVVWMVYLLTATYSFVQINDNRATAASAWSLATRGTLALPEAWEGQLRWEQRGVDGRLYTDRFPGTIVVAVPAYVVADLFGAVDEPTQPLFLNFVPAGLTAATIAALSVAVLFGVFRRLADRRTALLAAGLFAFGTASWSVTADAIWSHGPTSLALALGMLAMSRERHAFAGAAFALSILARPQTAVVPAVVGIWQGVQQKRLWPVIAIGTTSALGLAAVSLYSRALFGTWLPIAGYNPAKVDAVVASSAGGFLENVGYTLVHRDRGVLFYTPVLLVLLPFLHRGWRVAPAWARSSAVAGLVYLAVQLRANTWHGGFDYFGSRLTIETLVLAAPLLLCVWQAGVSRDRILRWAFTVLAVLSIAIHAVGATVLSAAPSRVAEFQAEVEDLCSSDDAPAECERLGFDR